MRPEKLQFLLACFAGTESSSQIEAFLRLQIDRLRQAAGCAGPEAAPAPRLDLAPEVRRRAEEKLRAVQARAGQLGAYLLTPWDEDYPARLRSIAGPPPILYGRGERPPPLERSVAVVGTRTPSRWGRRTADRISSFFAERGWTVVSGLAVGIDRRAHESALRFEGRTAAILPCALDRVEPAPHRALAEEIVAAGGVLLSELPFGTSATPASRVRRDRLQSGVSVATIVVETEVEGGAMHTARFAGEQGRPLHLAVPPDSSAFQSRGVLQLLYGERVGRPLEVPAGLGALERELSGVRGRGGGAVRSFLPL